MDVLWRERVLQSVLGWVSVMGSILAVVDMAFGPPVPPTTPAYVAMLLLFAATPVLWLVRLPYQLRAASMVVCLGTSVLLALMIFGPAPAPILGLLFITVCAGFFLGRRALVAALFATSVGVATCLFFGGIPNWADYAIDYLLVSAGAVALASHVLAQLEAQERILSSRRRLELIGRLAGGVAHDVNNALQIVVASTEELNEHADADVREHATEIERAVEFVRGTTRQLLALGGKQATRTTTQPLGDHLGGWLEGLQRLVPADLVLDVSVQDTSPVAAESTQLQQIVLNLVLNAKEAGASQIRVALLDDERPSIQVCDNGPGIPADLQAQVFEPFFTTRDEGTGLGLAVVSALTDQLGGALDLSESEAGGACMRISLPAAG